ncbi:FecR family protein [Novosphingobium kaempferiae]|uniref:FecR family protein n=1 Tax=Novosphingobium kaempferiae TaxID=2896849 RepID=UPI001E54CE9C|nr:FecR family protein [Novosphingobium kaempferiae]
MTNSIKRTRSRTGWLRAALACTTAAAGLTTPTASRAEIAAGTALRVELSPRTVARTERASVRGERFASGPNETFEILLSDGGSIVLGPSSAVLVSDYTFDPATGTGSFSAQLEAGSVRLMGGQLNRAAPIELVAPGGRLSLANGGAFVTTESGGTRASLLAGTLAVMADRGDVRIEKPGFEAVIADGGVSAPRRQSRGRAFADAAVINPGLRTGGMARLVKVAESDVDAEAEQAPETDTQLVRSEVAINQPTGSLEFGGPGRTITLPGGQVITVAGVSTGTVPTQGNPSLGDAANDLLLAQDLTSSSATACSSFRCRRDVGLASNRFIGSPSFDYDLKENSPSSLTRHTIGGVETDNFSEDLSYIFSLGLAQSANQEFSLEIERTQISQSADKSFIEFNNELYYLNSDGYAYVSSDGKEIGYVDSMDYFFISTRFEEQDLLILTSQPELASISDAGRGGYALILPILSFPDDGTISVSQYNGPVLAKSITGAGAPSISDPSKAPTTYEGYVAYINEYLVDKLSIGDIDVGIGIFQKGFGSLEKPPGTNGDRSPNNFLYIEQTSLSDNSIFVFGTGDVSRTSTRLSSTASIDSFALTRGLNTADLATDLTFKASDAPLAFRAFMPTQTLPAGIDVGTLQSTPLYVANPAGSLVSRLYQADFGLSANGSASTISVTLGTLTYADGVLNDDRAQVTVAGRTFGSTHSGSSSTLAISSPLVASSFGGDESNPGYASYFVLENVGEGSGTTGGTIDQLNGNSSQYGFLRLATRDETVLRGAIPVASNTGYVAGLVETAAGGRLALGRVSNVSVNGADNTVDAAMQFDGSTYQLGGSGGASAFIDRENFAAATTTGAVLVAGAGLVGDSTAFADLNTRYQHVQWGFFFGDMSTGSATDPQRHTALSSWAVGERWAGAPVQSLSGRATYSGHAIGSVIDNQTSRVDVGKFTQDWDFSGRKYAMSLQFPAASGSGPDATYSIGLTPGSGASYSGLSNLVNNVQASVTGELVGNGAALPLGTVGQFQMLNTTGTYSVVGTFAGETRP